jgi:RHS repeat-associated protein
METLAVAGNNVRAALLAIAQGEQPKRLEFAYDYLGRRVQKKVYDYDTAVAGDNKWVLAKTTRYLYQGWNLVAEFDTGTGVPPVDLSAPARTFHWGLDSAGSLTATGGVGALLMIQDGGSQYFPAYDGNGNVTGLMDNTGTTVAVYEYSPYGELLRCQGGHAKANPFRFSTKYWDEETGLIYYGLRYYSPQMGKFINRDPIGENGGLNLYGFVRNNPVNLVDVLGMACYYELVGWDDYPDYWDDATYTVTSRRSDPIYGWVCDDDEDGDFGGGGGTDGTGRNPTPTPQKDPFTKDQKNCYEKAVYNYYKALNDIASDGERVSKLIMESAQLAQEVIKLDMYVGAIFKGQVKNEDTA